MLHELLKIKRIREQAAETEVRKRKQALSEAKQLVIEKQKELEDYVEWRIQEENRLYDNIMNTPIQNNDLDHVKQKVAIIREKDVHLEQAIVDAENGVKEAEKVLESAQEAHAQAIQAVQKFEEFTKVQDEELKKEAERVEELEMEEFTVRPKY